MRAAPARAAFALLLAAACLTPASSSASPESTAAFSILRGTIEHDYAYPERLGPWKRAIGSFARRARDDSQLRTALEGALGTLRDDHVELLPRDSTRAVAAQGDLHAALTADGAARIDAVRVASEADVAGLRPGQVITHIAGVPVAAAVASVLADEHASPGDRQWALGHLLGGPAGGVLHLRIRGESSEVVLERRAPPEAAAFLVRAIGEHRDIAYLRPGFDAKGTRGRAWARGLREMRGARAVIVDLRATQGPATRAETLEMLAAFARSSGPWQRRRDRSGKTYTDTIVPAPWALRVPLVVLVDRWTADEAEALAAGLQAVAAAPLIGTPMAGLHGEPREVSLASSGLVLRYPAQRVFTPGGSPRERLLPDVPVDLAAPSGGPGDPILYQALKRLER